MIKKISIAGWYAHFDMLVDFLDYYYSNPQYFYQDRIIDSIYDVYSYGIPLVWSGGRVPLLSINPYPTMNDILKYFNNFPQIKLRHTFTNCLLDDDCLINDFRCNQFVQKYIRPQDEIIVNHPKLIKHLQTNYPQIKLVYSTTLGITNINKINELTENNIYVMNYNKNDNDDYINKLIHKENIEILCAETCAENCPHRSQHYKNISKKILDTQTDIMQLNDSCMFQTARHDLHLVKDVIAQKLAVNNERMEQLSNMGIQYFKLVGRSIVDISWLDILLYYLAQPEYIDELKNEFIIRWWNLPRTINILKGWQK